MLSLLLLSSCSSFLFVCICPSLLEQLFHFFFFFFFSFHFILCLFYFQLSGFLVHFTLCLLFAQCIQKKKKWISSAHNPKVLDSGFLPHKVQKKKIRYRNKMHRFQKAFTCNNRCHSYQIASPLPTVDVRIKQFFFTPDPNRNTSTS